MKKVFIFIIVLICFIQIDLIVFADNSIISPNKITYKDTTIIIDQPASLDAYVICFDKNDNEIWHTKLYSYDFIAGVSMDAQKVGINSIDIENDTLRIVDSRDVVYYINPINGEISEIDNNNYSLPDFSNVSNPTISDNNGGVVKYLAIFVGFIIVGIIVFIASRNKK